MNIKINDERIDQVIPVALENIKVEITEAVPQTFTTINEKGDEEEVILNIKQAPVQTTLKDLDAKISNLEINVATTNNQLLQLNAELQEKRDLKVEIEAVVKPAFDANNIELAKIITK
jgi:citrate lyase gamma subunit